MLSHFTKAQIDDLEVAHFWLQDDACRPSIALLLHYYLMIQCDVQALLPKALPAMPEQENTMS